jgi:type IV pilus assembly protein PilO
MIKPANQALKTKSQELQVNMAKLKTLETEKVKAENLEAQLDKMENAITFFENKLPHKSQIHQVLSQVSDIVNRNNLKPRTNKTQKVKQIAGYIELPLQMELSGNFKNYYSFLLELEKLDRITKIREMDLTLDQDNPGNIKSEFIVSIFFQDING